MSFYDDVLYLSLLVASIVVGRFVRPGPNTVEVSKWISSLMGVTIVFLVSGIHGLHCVAAFAIQIATMSAVRGGRLHAVSFVLQFSYLIFFRLCAYVGLPSPPPHTNAIMMIMTLKLIGVALEMQETRGYEDNDDDDEEVKLRKKYKGVAPSPLDIFHYVFSHAGVLTGPYYKYRTFHDLYHSCHSARVDCDAAVLSRVSKTPVYLVLFLTSGYLFPLDAVETEDFYETTSLLYRFFYMTPVFFNFRMRFYVGFVLAECSCIAAGLGAYPERSAPRPGNGPTKLDKLKEIDDDVRATSSSSSSEYYNFKSVHNIDEWGVEFVPTMREALKTWNMTVQYWLAVNVYKPFPVRSMRTVAVMIVSSVWHGVYSGYYVSLGSVPFVLMVEDLYEKIMRKHLPKKGQEAYDWISWFMRVQWFSYLGMGFRLLRIDSTMHFWQSVFYAGHVALPLFYVAGLFVVKPMVKSFFAAAKKSEEVKNE